MKRRVAFITDCEGNLEFLWKCVRRSPFGIVKQDRDGRLVVRPGRENRFVYGGDVFDKGNRDIQLSKTLVSAKQDDPERVTLLMGNRDINKMRFASELSHDDLRRFPMDPVTPQWRSVPSFRGFHDQHPQRSLLENRVRWMLKYTMGAENVVDFRAQELGTDDLEQVCRHIAHDSVDQVVRPYLENAQLAARIGDTLFVHGAVSRNCAGRIPGEGNMVGSLDDWVDGLNHWARDQVEEWKRYPEWNKARTWRGGAELMKYCHPDNLQDPRTVVYNSWLVPRTQTPKKMDPVVFDYLVGNGIRKVVTGHMPHGDCPLVIRHRKGQDGQVSHVRLDGANPVDHNADGDIVVITGDTSFSDKSSLPDLRGDVHYGITITANSPSVRIRGCNKTQVELDYDVGEDGNIGTLWGDPDGTEWIVKGKTTAHDAYYLTRASVLASSGAFSSDLESTLHSFDRTDRGSD